MIITYRQVESKGRYVGRYNVPVYKTVEQAVSDMGKEHVLRVLNSGRKLQAHARFAEKKRTRDHARMMQAMHKLVLLLETNPQVNKNLHEYFSGITDEGD